MVADQDGMHGIVTWIKHSYMCIYIYADNYCVAYLSGIPTNIAGSITLGLALSPADYWFWWRTNWRSVQSEVMTPMKEFIFDEAQRNGFSAHQVWF